MPEAPTHTVRKPGLEPTVLRADKALREGPTGDRCAGRGRGHGVQGRGRKDEGGPRPVVRDLASCTQGAAESLLWGS